MFTRISVTVIKSKTTTALNFCQLLLLVDDNIEIPSLSFFYCC